MKRCFVYLLLFSVLPFFFSVNTAALSSKSAVVINGQTGNIIYSENPNERLAMASTTKIMTALLLCESGNLDEEITVTDEMVRVEGTSMGLVSKDRVTKRDLLYGMMLSSGNDAANAAAISVAGSIDKFCALMNRKALEMGLSNTNFETPSGLDGENHYTTAYELALIARKALEYEEIKKAVSSKSAVLCFGNPPYKRYLKNHNKLLSLYTDVIGVKTGFTKKAGRCLVSAAKQNENYVIAVTLNDSDDWSDHRFLLDTGLNSLTNKTCFDEKTVKIPVIDGKDSNLCVKLDKKSFSLCESEAVQVNVILPKMLYAPIKKNKKIGTVNYVCNDRIICSEDILANKNIVKSSKNKYTFFGIVLEIIRRINERQ